MNLKALKVSLACFALTTLSSTAFAAATSDPAINWKPAGDKNCNLSFIISYDPDKEPATGYKPAFFYGGGGWRQSDAIGISEGSVAALVDAGYIVYSSDYRAVESENTLSHPCTKTTRDQQFNDVQQAFTLAIMHANWGEYDVDLAQGFVLSGHSAGGHLAMSLGRYGSQWVRDHIRAIVPVNAPLNVMYDHWMLNGNNPNVLGAGDFDFGTVNVTTGLGESIALDQWQDYYNDTGTDNCSSTGTFPNLTLSGTDCYSNNVDSATVAFLWDNSFIWHNDPMSPIFYITSALDWMVAPEPTLQICEWHGPISNQSQVGNTLFGDCGTTLNRMAVLTTSSHSGYDASFWSTVLTWAESSALD